MRVLFFSFWQGVGTHPNAALRRCLSFKTEKCYFASVLTFYCIHLQYSCNYFALFVLFSNKETSLQPKFSAPVFVSNL